jgi:hypothetical protein
LEFGVCSLELRWLEGSAFDNLKMAVSLEDNFIEYDKLALATTIKALYLGELGLRFVCEFVQ